MLVILADKIEERGWSHVVCSTTVVVPLPSHLDGSINADEQEEWSFEQGIHHGGVPYVGGDPAFPPPQRDEVEQRIDILERVLRVYNWLLGGGLLIVRRRRGWC
jgi:hypothetical protein